MPTEENNHSEAKSEIAQEKPRDSEGHFVHVDNSTPPQHQNAVEKIIHETVNTNPAANAKSGDDIVDVSVHNPLHKIVALLEDIKKQKAFSFTLKGSLGIAGVALALGVFGVFGGGKILCDKGVQSEIGTIQVLNVMDSNPSTIPFLGTIINYFAPPAEHPRIVLVKSDTTALRLPYTTKVNFGQYANLPVVATGEYDSCSQTLTVSDASEVEVYTSTSR